MKYIASLMFIILVGCFLAARLWKRSRLIVVYELRKVGGI